MREAVTAVFVHQEELFVVGRQPHLRAFPGYLAFPGGKVDRGDDETVSSHPLYEGYSAALVGALQRELREELGFDLAAAVAEGSVSAIRHLGVAVTPAFERVRFRAHHFRIELLRRPDFFPDEEEIAWCGWEHPKRLLAAFDRGEHLMVSPTVNLLRTLARNTGAERVEPFNLVYDQVRALPYLELIKGVGIIPVPSKTLPPARFTNALVIGERGSPVCIVDPSPESELVYAKLLRTLRQHPVDLVLLSHHHPDHHQFAPQLARELGLPLACTKETATRLLASQGADYLDGLQLEFLCAGTVVTRWLGRDVICHRLPGHDDGMVGLAPENNAWFFVADLIQTMGSVVIPEPEGNMGEYLDSLRRVIALNPGVILPSHGMPAGKSYLLEQVLQHRLAREAQVQALLDERRSVGEMVRIIYPGLELALQPLAAQNVRQHLRNLGVEPG